MSTGRTRRTTWRTTWRYLGALLTLLVADEVRAKRQALGRAQEEGERA